MEVAREVEGLRRTHDVIKGRCARGLDAEIELLGSSGSLTAVIAHRHAWFVDKLGLLLGEQGVTVLVCTDNGDEALGAVVADQPDMVDRGRPPRDGPRPGAPGLSCAIIGRCAGRRSGVRLICEPCREQEHERCPGKTWCYCQHRRPGPVEPATGAPGE